jgi:hypothetical protein
VDTKLVAARALRLADAVGGEEEALALGGSERKNSRCFG